MLRTALFWAVIQGIVAFSYRQVIPRRCKELRLLPADSGPFKMGHTGCPETSVRRYLYSLRNIPDERRYHSLRGGILTSCHVAEFPQRHFAVVCISLFSVEVR